MIYLQEYGFRYDVTATSLMARFSSMVIAMIMITELFFMASVLTI